MIIPELLTGTFQERPNRFTVKFNMGNETELAHLRDPGRLTELLLPGVELLLRPAQNAANRKTKYDVLAVLHEGRWVLINSGFHSDIAADLIESGLMDEFTGYSIEKGSTPMETAGLIFCWQTQRPMKNSYLKSKDAPWWRKGMRNSQMHQPSGVKDI